MADVPIIVPVLVSGLMLGLAWRNNSKIGMKRLGLGSVLSGLANGGYAYVVTLLASAGLAGSALNVYLLTSILTGLLIVLAIFGIASLMSKGKGVEGREEQIESFLESPPEEESKPDKAPPQGSHPK